MCVCVCVLPALLRALPQALEDRPLGVFILSWNIYTVPIQQTMVLTHRVNRVSPQGKPVIQTMLLYIVYMCGYPSVALACTPAGPRG